MSDKKLNMPRHCMAWLQPYANRVHIRFCIFGEYEIEELSGARASVSRVREKKSIWFDVYNDIEIWNNAWEYTDFYCDDNILFDWLETETQK